MFVCVDWCCECGVCLYVGVVLFFGYVYVELDCVFVGDWYVVWIVGVVVEFVV